MSGGVVFSAPPLSSGDSSGPSDVAEKEYYEEASAAVPGSPVHADLQYLHRNLQKVHSPVSVLCSYMLISCFLYISRRVVVNWI